MCFRFFLGIDFDREQKDFGYCGKKQRRNKHNVVQTSAFQFANDSVQSLSCVQLFVTPWTAARQASLSITNSRSLLKLMSIKSVMPSNHLILCHPLLLPSIFPSIRVFSNGSVLCIRWPKYLSFNFSGDSYGTKYRIWLTKKLIYKCFSITKWFQAYIKMKTVQSVLHTLHSLLIRAPACSINVFPQLIIHYA